MFLLTVAVFVSLFWWYGRESVRISPDREYYFLVKDCEETTVSAVAGQVYRAGGAGYPMEVNGRCCVALACYFRLTDAERVLTSMEEKGAVARIVTLSSRDFTLRGADAALKERVEGNLQTAETCARILYDGANGLERTSLTQEEAKTAVRGATKALKGLCARNTEALFARWNALLLPAVRRGGELDGDILFSKDLRALQTQLCLAVLAADSCFS